MKPEKRVAIVWFRRDLRVEDNPAIVQACKNADHVIPLFVWAPQEESPWQPGAASQWWLHHSLNSLQKELSQKNSKLILRQGKSEIELKEIIKVTGASSVYWNHCYEPVLSKRDASIKESLNALGVEVKSYNGGLLFEPWSVRNKQGKPYKVYTPFWNSVTTGQEPDPPVKSPSNFKPPSRWPASQKIKDLKLEPEINWAQGFKKMWQPGRPGAVKKLKAFSKERVFDYENQRNMPSVVGTSQLAPHLHFGEISPREVWQSIRKNQKTTPYLKQIIWREFSHHLLFHFPHTPDKPLDIKFEKFAWKKNTKYLKAWQIGQTGYPIVDAGMRELWHTGWMHNRVRMIVASFLVKDLMIPWQEGAKWFWDTLVDADLANNTMGWQWVAGCGADAAPFFRIFNPVTQGEKFDPEGQYVSRWIPEIAKLPKKLIHKPWQAPTEVLKKADLVLGRDYAKPIVDHELARRQALHAYERIK